MSVYWVSLWTYWSWLTACLSLQLLISCISLWMTFVSLHINIKDVITVITNRVIGDCAVLIANKCCALSVLFVISVSLTESASVSFCRFLLSTDPGQRKWRHLARQSRDESRHGDARAWRQCSEWLVVSWHEWSSASCQSVAYVCLFRNKHQNFS